MLAWFAAVKSSDRVIDIGSGSGVLSVLLAKLKKVNNLTAVELQPEMYNCLTKTIELNALADVIQPMKCDIKEFSAKHAKAEKFNFAICNPPYRQSNTGRTSNDGVNKNARFDDNLSTEDLLTFCKKNLYFSGRLALTGDADRLADIIVQCRAFNFEPKRLTFLYPSADKRPKVFFLECIHGAGVELTVEPPVIQNGGGIYPHILQGKWT